VQVYGPVVLMAAELEFAAWDLSGAKLWSMFVEPPWTCRVAGGQVHLDVMGARTQFSPSSPAQTARLLQALDQPLRGRRRSEFNFGIPPWAAGPTGAQIAG
jgi:hypothetical protein